MSQLKKGQRVTWTVKPRLGRVIGFSGDDVIVKWDDMGFAQHLPRKFVAAAVSR